MTKKKEIVITILILFSINIFTVSALSVDIPVPINYTQILINGTTNHSNSSDWLITNDGAIGNINTTQFSNNGGFLNIIESWVDSLWCRKTGCTMTGNLTVQGNITANDFFIPDMKGNNNYESINDWWNLYTSPGRLTGGGLTNPSGTNVVVKAGEGTLRIADDDTSQLKFIGWEDSSPIEVPTNSIMYFGVEYNGGSPQIINTTDENDFDLDTSFPLGSAINQAGEIYILNNSWWVGDGITNLIEKSQGIAGYLARDQNIGGLILGYTGTRNPTMTAGTLWGRANEFGIPAFDASLGDDFDYYYRDGAGGYTEMSDETQWNNTHYDDGSGTLQEMNNNYYANIWVFVNIGSQEISLIFPQNEYSNVAVAEAEEVPNTFPSYWYKGGILIGRILIKKGQDEPIEVQSAFTQTFTAAQAADHGNLAGLTDDDHKQYARTDGTRNITGPQIFEDTVTLWDDYNGIFYHIIRNVNTAPGYVVGSMYRLEASHGVWGGLGLTGNSSTISGGMFIDTLHLYSQGYGDNLYTVDGNHDHVWYTDPTDSHNFSALDNEVMRLDSDGNLNVTGNFNSTGNYWQNGLKYGCCNETNGECFEIMNTSLINWELCDEW